MVISVPLFALAVKAIMADLSPAVILVIVGASGVVAGTTDNTFDAGLLPFAFTARILMEYVVPLFNPIVAMSGLAVVPELRAVQSDQLSPAFDEDEY